MNPTAIFSKSGKGVQEASGKTSQLSRPDRAVLSAIDGRVTLGDVAQKVGKQFDNDFKALITKLDKDGFIREVSPGAAGGARPGAAPAKPAPSKPTAPMDMASDLDFTAAMAAVPKKGAAAPPPQAVSRAPAPPPKPTVAVPPAPPPPSAAEKAKQAQIAKEQQSAFTRAREEAERKAQEERDRVKSEAEAKIRAETEAKMRAEAEQKMKADIEAAAKRAEAEAAAARSAAIRAAAEAKVRAEAEAKRAREEAERAKREAEEKAERARREAEEKARREQEELRRKLEEERRAREEAERRAKEEAERARRELEEERRKLEEERKAREEQQRREDDERRLQRELQEQQEEAERTARRKQREEEEERERAAGEEQRQAKAAETAAPPSAPKAKPAATGDAFADSLLADLDSFTQRDDEDRKAKEEAERKAKEEAARKKHEEAERQEREAAEIRERMEAERRRKEEEAQQAREEEERRVRRQREEQEQIEQEAEERRRKMAAAAAPAGAAGDDIGITDEDLELDEVKREQALLEKKKNRKEEREKEREKERQKKLEAEREAKSKKAKEREEKEAKKASAYRPRRKSHLGRNLFVGVLLLLVVGVGVLHVMPVSTAEYERAATEALGVPVKIGAGHFSMIGGVQFRFEDVSIGSVAIPTVRAYPELGSILEDKKIFARVELEGMSLPQAALGEVLFAREKSDNLKVPRISLRNLKLSGALPLPPLDGELQLESGALRTATLRGPEGLIAKLDAKGEALQFDVSTAQFTLPFAQGITLVQFSMKGDATRHGMKISQWDGLLFSGHVTGTASMRWGSTWSVEGVMTARGMNAAVFAPALVSDGRVEGTGRFSMSGVEPAKLAAGARLEGNFTVQKGVLGSFDLSKALQTAGRQTTGQTQFAEMSGQGVYERGAVSLRNINLGAGALNAGASADVDERGALSGRIVADVKTSTQNLRATLILGGTVQEPQVRN